MKILNRKAKFDFLFLEKYEAGIALTGAEVKALRAGKGNITQAYGKELGGELYLINANITVDNPTRSRKLLLHKKEIVKILSEIKAKKLTLVPTKVYTKGRHIKVELALAKAKKTHQKRQVLKNRDIKREIERELKDNDQ